MTLPGERHPDAEFNVRMDPEAYHIIAQHATPDKVTILPFSQVKDHLNISLVSIYFGFIILILYIIKQIGAISNPKKLIKAH